MKFIDYLEERISFVIFEITFIFILTFFLNIFNIPFTFIILMIGLLLSYTIIYLILDYNKKTKKSNYIIDLVDSLEDKYLIAEILPKDKSLQNKSYYYALKTSCKALNDKLSTLENDKLDYQEYIESFAHEIKTSIAALSLTFDNNKNTELKKEVKKIDNLVEQMLFYARSDNTEKDYFIKKLKLEEVVHLVLLNYKEYLLNKNITLNINALDNIVYTDEKWLTFIISQIVQNSIKYLDKKEKVIQISSEESTNNVVLIISDNGCGIKESDLMRVFEKGFTGTNRKKEHSTGIGLYLASKICKQLGLNIEIESKEKLYTKIKIIFPKNNFHIIEN